MDTHPSTDAPGDLSGKTLAHYELTEKIGQGGMGQVYRAWDRNLGREVAIKVLSPAVDDDPDLLARLGREARLLASLNHPNIATIHGFEDWGGVRFLVLELVEGQTLYQRIAAGPIPVEQAQSLFAQLAAALETAHEKGVVHRDLKPANIKITPKGLVKVLDFGLAKAVKPPLPNEATPPASMMTVELATRLGVLMGTIPYMSPEQVRGEPADARSDIWAFGCTLFEALTGKPAFASRTEAETIAAILEHEPAWDALPADTPAETRRLLQRCLHKEPDRRLSDIREATGGLVHQPTPVAAPTTHRGWILVPSILVLVALGLFAMVWWRESPPPSPLPPSTTRPAAPTVAVTALDNLTGDSELDWLEEGLAGLARDRLAESKRLAVVSRPRWDAIARLAGGQRDITEVAAEAGIGYLLTGEIIATPGGWVVAARVTDTKQGRDLLSERIDSPTLDDLLESAPRLAMLAKRSLNIPHTESVGGLVADYALDRPGAYELYLAGLEYLFDYSYEDAERAFRQVLAMEPDFHIASYRLAHVLAAMGRIAEAQTTIDAIPDDPAMSPRERMYIRGAQALFGFDFDQARQIYRDILEDYPYDVEARIYLAIALDGSRDDAAALKELRFVAAQEPENPNVWVSLGETYVRTGQLDEAQQAMTRFLALDPRNPIGFTVLGDLQRALGEPSKAIESYRRALELSPRFDRARLGLATTLSIAGETDQALRLWREIVDDGDSIPGDRIEAAFGLSAVLAGRGAFADAEAPLLQLETLIREEEFREALALSVRGLLLMERGELDEAELLIVRAVERSPEGAPPTRYLFARGLLALRRGDASSARVTAEEIRAGALPAEHPDRTEDKAASYLEGLADLADGQVDAAVGHLREAVELGGYRYRLYRLGLARALVRAGEPAEALRLALETQSDPGDPGDPRIDLELDRTRALLVQAVIHASQNRAQESRRLAASFLDRFGAAPDDHPDGVLARRLLTESE